jgi:hypothetical protein
MFALHSLKKKEVCIAFWQTMCHSPQTGEMWRATGSDGSAEATADQACLSPYMQIHNSYVCPRKFKPGCGALVGVSVSTVCFSLLSVLAKNRSGHTPNKGGMQCYYGYRRLGCSTSTHGKKITAVLDLILIDSETNHAIRRTLACMFFFRQRWHACDGHNQPLLRPLGHEL